MARGVVAVLIAACAIGCGGEDDAPCDSAALASALAAAGPGDTVNVGACRVTGSFMVPNGVTLAGTEGSVIVADTGVGVRLDAGAAGGPATVVRDLTIESSARVGVLAMGAGPVTIRNVTVLAQRGFGVGIEGSSSATIEDVTVEGPVTEANQNDAVFLTPAPDATATYGIALLAVGNASLARITVRGLAQFGVAILDRTSSGTTAPGTVLTWGTGSISDTLGTGLYVSGGTSTLTDLQITRTLRGLRGTPTYGAVFTGGADVTTVRLRVCDGSDYGILQEGGSAQHTELEVCGNATGGLMIADAVQIQIDGSSRLLDNGAINALLLRSRNVTFRDVDLSRAVLTPAFLKSETSTLPIMLGDGLQLIGTYENVVLENVTLTDNQRAGLVVDLGAVGTPPPTFTAVTVSGTGTQLGAIGGTVDAMTVQLAPVAPGSGWDIGITRAGATLANDSALMSSLDVAGIIGPSMISRPNAGEIIGPSM